jgi:DNA polymerase III alpha subunit
VVRLSAADNRATDRATDRAADHRAIGRRHSPHVGTPGYVELHCHSAYSLLDGASLPEDLVERAVALGHRALALTDHDELGGVVAFAQAAHEREIAGIIGAEITVAGALGDADLAGMVGAAGDTDSHLVLLAIDREGYGNLSTLVTRARMDNPRGRPRVPLDLVARHAHGLFALTGCPRGLVPSLVARGEISAARDTAATLRDIFDGSLAIDREGYGNLSTLVTRARMDNPRGRPRVPLDLVARHARGLFALTGCPRGRVPSLVARGEISAARRAAATLRDIFDGRLAVECWDHGLSEERAVVPHLVRIARDIGVQWVVTNDVHYAAPDARATHDVLCALRHELPLAEMGTRLRPNGEWYLKSAAQMRHRWRHHPEALRATVEIAERCAFRMRDLRPSLPKFPLPPGVTADDYLASLVAQGAGERYRKTGFRVQGSGERKQGTGNRKQELHERPVIPAQAGIHVDQTERGSPLARG